MFVVGFASPKRKFTSQNGGGGLPNFQEFLPNLSSQALVHAEDI